VFLTLQDIGDRADVPSFGVVSAIDEKHDLALVTTVRANDSFVTIASPQIERGAKVYSLGHPGSKFYTLATGMMLFNADDYCMVAIAISPGASGGGLYDENWNLIGVASAMLAGGSIGKFYNAQALQALQ